MSCVEWHVLFVMCLGVKCQVSCVKCHVSCVMCQVSSVKCQVSSVKCHVSSIKCYVSNVMFKCQAAIGWVFYHSSGSLEGGCPSSAEVIYDTEDSIYSSGFYSTHRFLINVWEISWIEVWEISKIEVWRISKIVVIEISYKLRLVMCKVKCS